jgi:hypothetical protein
MGKVVAHIYLMAHDACGPEQPFEFFDDVYQDLRIDMLESIV